MLAETRKRIVAINLAYGVLSQAETRQAYDATQQGSLRRWTADHVRSQRTPRRPSPPFPIPLWRRINGSVWCLTLPIASFPK